MSFETELDLEQTPDQISFEDFKDVGLENFESASFAMKEMQCYIKCHVEDGAVTVNGYLGVTRSEWATIVPNQHRWNLVPDKNGTAFYLKSLQKPGRNKYMGHRAIGKRAGVYGARMHRDWLMYDGDSKKLINVNAGRRFFGRSKDNKYFWITSKEAAGKYTKVYCEIIPV